MKKSTKALTITGAALAATVGVLLTACHETVYGPPPEDVPETVYGPPSMLGLEDPAEQESIEESFPEVSWPEEESEEEKHDVILPDSEPVSDETLVEPLYGPPPDFEAENNMEQDVYGPPADIETEEIDN